MASVMTADSAGNDVTAVAVPVTGNLGIAPSGSTIPTPVEGGSPSFTLPLAFTKAGLIKTDGGPQWAWAPDGDAIEFWQDGYEIPSGLADVTLTATFAQTDDFIRSVSLMLRCERAGILPTCCVPFCMAFSNEPRPSENVS